MKTGENPGRQHGRGDLGRHYPLLEHCFRENLNS